MQLQIDKDSKLEGEGALAFTKDKEGKNIIKLIRQGNIDKSENEFAINARKFYMHYPYNPPRVSCFGYGYNYKLGNNECYSTTSAPIIMQRLEKPVKKLVQRSTYTICLTDDNMLYRCGYKGEWNKTCYYMEEYSGKLPDEKIIDLRGGYNNIAVLTENHKIYIQGYCTSYHLESGSTKNVLWHKIRPNEEEEKVSKWDVGYDYHLYVTDNGKAYGAGNEFLRGIDLENNSKDYKLIPFDEDVIPLEPVCSNNYESSKAALMFVMNKGRKELWSAGYSSYGLLGQGDQNTTVKKFRCMDYNPENITFVRAQIYYYFGMALTDKGELYGWGNNSYKPLGMSDTKTYYSPTEIPFFKDYVVHDFSVGYNMALICASPKNNPDVRQLFLTGDKKGLDYDGTNNDGIFHMKQYDNCNHRWLS